MRKHIAWRLALIIPTLLAASVVIFVVMRALPGDVVLVILGGSGDTVVSPEVREALEEELGLNDPLVVQYGRWLWSMVSGEFGGRSLETREPIRSIVGRQLPVTALLAGYTLLLSVVVSLPLGVLAAARSNRWSDYVVRPDNPWRPGDPEPVGRPADDPVPAHLLPMVAAARLRRALVRPLDAPSEDGVARPHPGLGAELSPSCA